MLNQERVCEMTRMAMFDQKEGRECRPMIEYFRKDYIAKEMLKSFVVGTIAYFIAVVMFVLYSVEDLLDQINGMDFRQVGFNVVLGYVVFIVIYSVITYVIYNVRYTRGRQKVKDYYIHLKRVNRLYQEEEQI